MNSRRKFEIFPLITVTTVTKVRTRERGIKEEKGIKVEKEKGNGMAKEERAMAITAITTGHPARVSGRG